MTDYTDILSKVLARHTDSLSTKKNDRVLLVDGTNLFLRTFSAVPTLNINGEHIGGWVGFLRSLSSVVTLWKPTRCIVVFDGQGGSTRRKSIDSNYKQNRSMKSNVKRADWVEGQVDEGESLVNQMVRLVEYLRYLPVDVLVIDNVEADDVIAYLAMQYFTDSKVTISSNDRDFLQLVSERVNVWFPFQKKMYTPQLILEEFHTSATNFILRKCILGDTGDNVSGVKGVGPKFVEKNLTMLREDTDHSITDLIEYCKENQDKATGYKKIVESEDTIRRGYRLMQLADVDVAAHILLDIRANIDIEGDRMDKIKIRTMMITDKAIDAIPNFESWVSTFDGLNRFRGK